MRTMSAATATTTPATPATTTTTTAAATMITTTTTAEAVRIVVPHDISKELLIRTALPKLIAISKERMDAIPMMKGGDNEPFSRVLALTNCGDRFDIELHHMAPKRPVGLSLTCMIAKENPGVWVLTGHGLSPERSSFQLEEKFMSCFDAATDTKAFYELLLERVNSCFELGEEHERYVERMEAQCEARRAAKRARRSGSSCVE